jgi:glutathione peroxidase-family protein
MNLQTLLRSTISIRTVLFAASQIQHISTSSQTCSKDDRTSDPKLSSCNSNTMAAEGDNWKNAASVYDFTAKDIDGNDVSLSKYKGQVLMIVNVACKCGFTNNHYKELVELDEKYKAQGFHILGFPCNQFGSQEPAPENEIKDFVKGFNVAFDMFSKVEVNGNNAHPLWKYLKHKQGGTLVDAIKWNFTKFIVDRNGQPVSRHSPQTAPKELEKEIQKLLTAPAS